MRLSCGSASRGRKITGAAEEILGTAASRSRSPEVQSAAREVRAREVPP
jgi:hypothetical protein